MESVSLTVHRPELLLFYLLTIKMNLPLKLKGREVDMPFSTGSYFKHSEVYLNRALVLQFDL